MTSTEEPFLRYVHFSVPDLVAAAFVSFFLDFGTAWRLILFFTPGFLEPHCRGRR